MKICLLTVAILFAAPSPGYCQPDSSISPELAELQRFLGKWDSEVTNRAAGREPEQMRLHSSSVYEPILDGRVLQGIEVTNLVETPEVIIKTLSLSTHDAATEQYVSWTFQSTGEMAPWRGKWDADNEVLSWTMLNPLTDISCTVKQDFRRKKSITGTMVFKKSDGTTFFNQEWTQTCKAEVLPDFTPELWSKVETPIEPIPAEVKQFQPMVGEWNAQYIQNPSAAYPDGSKSNATITGKWILDGRFFQGRAKFENYETIWVMGYDTDQQLYRYIRFDSRGAIEENTGHWKKDTRTFEWQVVNGQPGVKKSAVTRLIGDNLIRSRIISEDEQGKVLLDLTIRSTRKN